MAVLSATDLKKIPGYVIKHDPNEVIPNAAQIKAVVRNCYLIIAANTFWLLIPFFGLISGNNIPVIFSGLILSSAVLFLSNNYLGKRWYYYSEFTEGTPYQSHLDNIDHIGFRTFFVALVSGLAFLISSVFITNLFKSSLGQYLVLALDVALSAVLISLAVWILKRVTVGLALATKEQPYA